MNKENSIKCKNNKAIILGGGGYNKNRKKKQITFLWKFKNQKNQSTNFLSQAS